MRPLAYTIGIGAGLLEKLGRLGARDRLLRLARGSGAALDGLDLVTNIGIERTGLHHLSETVAATRKAAVHHAKTARAIAGISR